MFLLFQIDLISEQSAPDGEFKYIGHFMDHFTKYHVLFPLKQKSASDTLIRLVFSYFGLPYIFHSDSGTKFRNEVIYNTVEKWPGDAKIICGSPRHGQSQGLVEQGNFSTEMMVAAKRQDTQKTIGVHGSQRYSVSILTSLINNLIINLYGKNH